MSDGDGPGAQWARDPTGRHDYRYWDGTQWTGHVMDGGALPVDPPDLWSDRPVAPTVHDEPFAQYVDPEYVDPRPGDAALDDDPLWSGGDPAWATAVDEEEDDGDWDDDRPPAADRRRSFLAGALVGGGVVLVIAAAAYVLLDKDDGSEPSAAPTTTTTSTTVATTTTLPPTTTTTVNPGRPASQVTVRVINASGVEGAAGAKMTQLTGLGYRDGGLANAATRKGTAVQCRAGYEAEATTLAQHVGAGTTVEPFPTPAPPGTTDAVNCVVVLGTA
jgi:hypothetical protein